MINWKDTICALATPEGVGAIGVIRLSGKDTFDIVQKIFNGKRIGEQKTHTLHFGNLTDLQGNIIDEVLVSIFKNPHSFTGEDSAEISGHGSPYVLNRILQACKAAGARLAEPGEFTQRAFLNGKFDLAQAEAVADLIASENQTAHELALNQLRGGISNELAGLREQLINFTALIELELDFSDEDVAFADRSALEKLILELKAKLQKLIQSFEYGNAIKNGVPVAIIGKPNAGKSTLLNALLNEERAIVSDIAGTTRDVIEETITLDGITFRFIDTAGIRDTQDAIEAMGVSRAKEKIRQAKVVLHLYEDTPELLEEVAEDLKNKVVFNLHTKIDKGISTGSANHNDLSEKYPRFYHLAISVKSGYNLDALTEQLTHYFKAQKSGHATVISNLRHKEALEKSLVAIQEVENGLNAGLSGDLLSLYLKDALYHLGSITGKIEVDRDVLGAIFGKFCIGK